MYLKKINNRNYYYSVDNNTFMLYKIKNDKSVKSILSFNLIKHTACSWKIIQNINIYANLTEFEKKDSIQYFKDVTRPYVNSYAVITIQNSTKSIYDFCKELGFVDAYRLPGRYISTPKKGETSNNCLSIMVYKNKKNIHAFKKSLELLSTNIS